MKNAFGFDNNDILFIFCNFISMTSQKRFNPVV